MFKVAVSSPMSALWMFNLGLTQFVRDEHKTEDPGNEYFVKSGVGDRHGDILVSCFGDDLNMGASDRA